MVSKRYDQAQERADNKRRDEVREMLRNRPQWMSYSKIGFESEVSRGWVEKFAQHYYARPHMDKVNALYRYLKRNQRKFE